MRIRLGYVAMSMSLKDCSPSRTVTVANYNKIQSDEGKLERLRRITKENLSNTLRILRYNKAYNISLYRFTSKLVPLATYPHIENIDYANEFKEEFKAIGNFVKENDFRVSAHPDHFTLINSPNQKVIDDAIRDLKYHVDVYDAMGISDYRYKLVMHVGGMYKDKKCSIERFKENFICLPDRVKKRIILENDDKSYTALDVLEICRELHIPMVLDVHHHNCVNNGENIKDLLPHIFDTWNGEYFNPKVHFSSPKSCKEFRSHANDINVEDFYEFVNIAKGIGRDFDVMLEAKNKDMALLKLSEQFSKMDGIANINESEFEVL